MRSTQKHAWGDAKDCDMGDNCPNSHTLMEVSRPRRVVFTH
jgi:hypothetical protein